MWWRAVEWTKEWLKQGRKNGKEVEVLMVDLVTLAGRLVG